MAQNNDEQAMLVTLTADIVSAHVSNNVVAVSDMPLLIGSIHKALSGLNGGSAVKEEIPTPFVAIRNSVKPAHIVCLNCGEKLKMLKRHLNTHHGLTVEQYRDRWALANDYPLVAPDYAKKRRELAIASGLGKGGRTTKKRK